MAVFLHLAAGDIGGEGAGIDRCAKRLVIMRDGTNVILVGMGDEHGLKLIAAVRQPGDIRQDQVHAGAAIHIREGHPKIDKDQAFLPRFAIAIDIGVHADFARPA